MSKFEVQHTREDLMKLAQRLSRYDDAKIAIERPSGLLVDTLVEGGFTVVAIHPNVVNATRPRYSSVKAKSDLGDAYLLADLLRTDGHRFEPLKPLSDEVRALRALVRSRDDLVTQRVAAANQLRAVLESYWPGAAGLFAKIDSRISLAFLNRFPAPASMRGIGVKRLTRFLKNNGYTGRQTAEHLLAQLRQSPEGHAAQRETEAKKRIVLGYVRTLRSLTESIAELTKSIEQQVAELRCGQIMMSFPRAGRLNAAQIVSELGEDPARFGSEPSLAAQAGLCPVTHASGARRGVRFRVAVNKRLRRALTTFANNSRHAHEWAQAVYQRARARGKTHSHAIRILARAWVRVLWRCWNDGVEYTPEKHGALQALKTAG